MSKDKKPQENTILDIAEALKLSPATISRALNNHPHVKEKTKNDILKMAAQLGYRRNQMASGLRSNKTNTVGLIVPRISMFFHAEVITTIQNSLHKHGYNLIICQSNDLLSMEQELAEILYSSRVDALIVACTLQTTDFSHFDRLVDSGIPVIFYDRVPLSPYNATFIKGDDFRGGYLATTHLIETGCKRIAHISGKLSSNLYQDRTAGYRKAMEQHKLPINEDWVFHQELTHENAREAMSRMFEGEQVPDGLFSANDVSAIAALEFAKENGIAVPDTLKMIGYSNDPRTSIISPSLSTIEQHPDLVGKKIVEVLMDLLKNGHESEAVKAKPYVIPVDLIRRMSS
ncbi:LacI family DNA-binding transcriptional regulator [Pedobacter caeni]|uniref:Transcriptional regulator, LacI family n=1 Tax=Pedobacter caeni TaxID=288992 RepID=A0A1M5BRG1_9SPHI|nr:LacI family DNA-binding transcriptional regulator [Pedobacter caeni]SHF44822.1 transcriptional regulator, LacI family [Pedobacter caeni]